MIQSQFVRTHVPGAAFRAVLASDGGSGGTAPSGAASPFGPDVGPPPLDVTPPGFARQTRLGLDPRVRQKLERIEAAASAAHGEVLRLGALLTSERQHAQALVDTARTWEANYHYGVRKDQLAQVAADQAVSAAEQQRLAGLRDRAEQRWQQLAAVAEAARVYLGLPADDRRG